MHELQWGWVDPELKVQNIPIFKNGTNFVRHFVPQWGWIEKAVPLSKTRISRFVILREPYERWLTAFSQDLEQYFIHKAVSVESQFDKNHFNFDSDYILNLFEEMNPYWFFDFLIDKDLCKIDGHSNLQLNFIKNSINILGLDNISFIKMTDRLGDTLNYYLGTKQIKSHFTNQKMHSSSEKNTIIYRRVIEYFSDTRNYRRKERVLDYLTLDYELYNSVKFINNY